jgi:hypothetical protein
VAQPLTETLNEALRTAVSSGPLLGVALSRSALPTIELRNAESPPERGFLIKRLKGLEPSTFCMASRRSSQLSYSRESAEYIRVQGAGRARREEATTGIEPV